MNRIFYLHGFASGPGSGKAARFRDRLAAIGVRLEVPDLAAGGFELLTITSQLTVIERAAAGEPVSHIGSSMGGYPAARHANVRLDILDADHELRDALGYMTPPILDFLI